jgi:hypothetical protein
VKIISGVVKQLHDYSLNNSGAFTLGVDGNDLIFQRLKIGSKIPSRAAGYNLLKRLTIVSKNSGYNSFKSKIDEWERFIHTQFMDGVQFICLQDFPSIYIEQLGEFGHLVYMVYAVGNDNGFLVNAIIINPNYITQQEFRDSIVTYIPEECSNIRNFVPGTLLIAFQSKQIAIGSLYSSFASTVRSRRKAILDRFNLIYKYKEKRKLEVIICGDFNPRCLNPITDQQHVYEGILGTCLYHIRQIPLIILSKYFGVTPKQELEANAEFGLSLPSRSTMRDKQFGPFKLPLGSMDWTMDAAQSTLPSHQVYVSKYSKDDLSDHFTIRVTVEI